MAIVRINKWPEFLEELDTTQVKGNVARVTYSTRYDDTSTYLTLVSGIETEGGDIVECVEYQGRQPNDAASPAAQQLQKLLDDRKEALAGKGYTVRGGRFHVAPGARS